MKLALFPHGFSTPLDNGEEHLNTGCPLLANSCIILSAIEFHCPSGLSNKFPSHVSSFPLSWFEVFSELGDTLYIVTTHAFYFEGAHQKVSLYIDMKIDPALELRCLNAFPSSSTFLMHSRISIVVFPT